MLLEDGFYLKPTKIICGGAVMNSSTLEHTNPRDGVTSLPNTRFSPQTSDGSLTVSLGAR
jgi:hypothetical protein